MRRHESLVTEGFAFDARTRTLHICVDRARKSLLDNPHCPEEIKIDCQEQHGEAKIVLMAYRSAVEGHGVEPDCVSICFTPHPEETDK